MPDHTTDLDTAIGHAFTTATQQIDECLTETAVGTLIRLAVESTGASITAPAAPADPSTATLDPRTDGNSAAVTTGDPGRAGVILFDRLAAGLDLVALAAYHGVASGDAGEQQTIRILGKSALEAARAVGWQPPPADAARQLEAVELTDLIDEADSPEEAAAAIIAAGWLARWQADDLRAQTALLLDRDVHADIHRTLMAGAHEQTGEAPVWLAGYSEGVEHALDTLRMRYTAGQPPLVETPEQAAALPADSVLVAHDTRVWIKDRDWVCASTGEYATDATLPLPARPLHIPAVGRPAAAEEEVGRG